MLPEQGLLSDCGNNYFQMNSCILAGNVQTTPQVSSGDSEAKPLIFTFVPTVRRLPTHSQLTGTSKFLVKIPEEPSDKNPETVTRSNSNEYLTLNAESQQKRDQEGPLLHPTEISEKVSQESRIRAKEPQRMQQSDLFKAEYVFIVDSEGEDEAPTRKGEETPTLGMSIPAPRPKSLAISSSLLSDMARPKTQGVDLPSQPEIPHGTVPQQKPVQLTSSPSTSDQHACKPPAFSFVSPTNQQTPPGPATPAGASVLEEFHTRRLHLGGALVEETATYFQTSAHSSPFISSRGTCPSVQAPYSAHLPGSNLPSTPAAEQAPGPTPEVLKKTAPVASTVLSPKEKARSSPTPLSSASLKSSSASYIPVRIVMHSLSPSPKPFSTSLHGSSSTICSQMSSSGSLSKSGGKSAVPSRLSLLTAILKSNPSHQRPSSPASCPTFSLNSLASSTLTLDQKVKQTTSLPKKSLSSCSLRARTPEQGEHQIPELPQQFIHLPLFTKSDPLSQVPALSPTQHARSSLLSLEVEKALSPISWKSNPALSLQPGASSAGLPPVPPSLSPLSCKDKHDDELRGPERSKNIHTHPSPSTSSALSSESPTNKGAVSPSPEKRFYPSPALSNLLNRSKRTLSGQGQTPSSTPAVPDSSTSSDSLRGLRSSHVPPANPPSQAIPSNCGSSNLPSRLGKSESFWSDHRSSPSSLRTNELPSPCALAMPTDPENKTPKQYKTKSSYKALAAIPTNIFLLEQKALDKPSQTESISKDPPLEFYFPAQLRQQTEELCATIDKVLQDSLSMHSSDSPSSSDPNKIPTTLPRAAGRETKYANLSSLSSSVSENQLTKPGVIRPVPIKSKILLKQEEEIYEPNPFSKYLKESTELFSEQEVTVSCKPVSLHPLYQTKLYPPAKSLLLPQTLSHADRLAPGPFSHLSSFSLSDERENTHALFSHTTPNKK
ncbi:muscular LMNA-interacting protein isoform X2 [Sorex fumeus]|uniref:muscular LMNA-interacting protein isoform X2 n=1 Tax=Sorex fumeus TaxID=62283 RepID=UPI0024ADDFFB|nr:muscular LMNA-interacting protein isoform X2 [Sorex fumeus]